MIRRSLTRIIFVLLGLLTVTLFLGEISVAASNAGQNAASFLKIGQGARSAGLGGAYTAISDGAMAAYWNPAGLSSLESSEVAFGHFVWFQDITVEQFTIAMPVFGSAVTAASVTYVNYGTIDGFDEAGMPTGELSAYDLAAGLSVGFELTEALSVGVTGKYIVQRLDIYQATAFAADLGIKYSFDRLSLAAALSNVGTSLEFDKVKESLPQSLRLGVAYRPFGNSVMTSVEWEQNKGGETFLRQGVELGFSERYYLRTGYDLMTGEENRSLIGGMSVGGGMKFSFASFDYAYTPNYRSISEDLHRFTVVFNLGK